MQTDRKNRDNNEHYEMPPMTGETVEVDGVYKDEAGRELTLKRGDTFPADLTLGETEYRLVEFAYDNHHEGRTDPRLYPQADQGSKEGHFIATPLQHTQGDTKDT